MALVRGIKLSQGGLMMGIGRLRLCLLLGVMLGFSPGAWAAEEPAVGWSETGTASWYGRAHSGPMTASGVPFDENAMTCAHRSLPFGTRLRVTLQDTGREVWVVVTDRLRTARRVIDLSLGAARELGMVRRGVALVALTTD